MDPPTDVRVAALSATRLDADEIVKENLGTKKSALARIRMVAFVRPVSIGTLGCPVDVCTAFVCHVVPRGLDRGDRNHVFRGKWRKFRCVAVDVLALVVIVVLFRFDGGGGDVVSSVGTGQYAS